MKLAKKMDGFLVLLSFPLWQSWLSLAGIWVFPKIGGFPPKWMVYFMENPIKIHDLGGTPNLGNTHIWRRRGLAANKTHEVFAHRCSEYLDIARLIQRHVVSNKKSDK